MTRPIIRKIRQYGEWQYINRGRDWKPDEQTLLAIFEAKADAFCAQVHAVRGPLQIIWAANDPADPDPYLRKSTVGFKFPYVSRPPKRLRPAVESALRTYNESVKRVQSISTETG